MRPLTKHRFPENFMWGAASSSFQSEGAWTDGGKGKSVIGQTQTEENTTDFDSGVDFYHHYEEDIALMHKAGLRTFRFSIAWTRIFPLGKGKPNAEGVAFYHRVLQTLVDANIEPIVTIYHFDYPQALVDEYGGWLSRKSIADYVAYAAFLFKEFGQQVHYWLTINEQDHVVKMPYRLGIVGKTYGQCLPEVYQANHHMTLASAQVFELAHQMLPNTKIGIALSYQIYYPASSQPEDTEAAMNIAALTQNYLLDLQCKGCYGPFFKTYLQQHHAFPDFPQEDLDYFKQQQPDFIGVNYYSSDAVEFLPEQGRAGEIGGNPIPKYEYGYYRKVANPGLKETKWGWTIDPQGLKLALRQLYRDYGLALLVTENGYSEEESPEIADNRQKIIEDENRINYLRNHIRAVGEVVVLGVPILGYCVWSFTDIISGHSGMNKRYGLVFVNRTNFDLKDMARSPKLSFFWYQRLIETGGTEDDDI